MKFEEALPEMRKGKKIRFPYMENLRGNGPKYLRLEVERGILGDIVDDEGDPVDLNRFSWEENGWEVVKENPKRWARMYLDVATGIVGTVEWVDTEPFPEILTKGRLEWLGDWMEIPQDL